MNNRAFFTEVTTMVEEGETVSFPVKGTSMLPFLQDKKTEVFVRKADSYRVKDICLFEYKDTFLLHRLLKIKDEMYVFRGDHLYSVEVVSPDDIIGTVVYYRTDGKTIHPHRVIQRLKLHLYLMYKRVKIITRRVLKGR